MKIEFKHSFLKSVEKLRDSKLKDDILKVIVNTVAAETLIEIKNIKKLKGYTSYYRIRIGNYRIGVKWVDAENSIYL